MNEILLIGGGGHCKSVIDVALANKQKVIGVLDAFLPIGSKILNIPVLGGDELIEEYINQSNFLITVGSIKSVDIRRIINLKIIAFNGQLAKLISPYAYVSSFSDIGNGTVIMHNATVNSDTEIGENCIVNTSSILEHEVSISNFTHVSTGAIINGNCNIGENVFIGSNSIVKQGVRICNDVVIGAQSFVKEDILTPGIYVGIPAKRINSGK